MTDIGFYRAKIKLYGAISIIQVLEYFENLENYRECTLICKVIDEINRKSPPDYFKFPKRMSEDIYDAGMVERLKIDPNSDLSDLLETISENFDKILSDVAKENKTQSLN